MHSPELMREAGVSARGVYERFCQENSAVLSACPQNASIFDGLYTIDRTILQPYARLKFQELMLVLSRTPAPVSARRRPIKPTRLPSSGRFDEELLSDLGQRRTIEELSKRYLMNPSTLKDVFKFVYGQPIAAHMKEHRLERAALLLADIRIIPSPKSRRRSVMKAKANSAPPLRAFTAFCRANIENSPSDSKQNKSRRNFFLRLLFIFAFSYR